MSILKELEQELKEIVKKAGYDNSSSKIQFGGRRKETS